MSLGSPRRHLRRCTSTNLVARDLAEAGGPHGTLVSAEAQSAGRGRQGRAWIAPPRSSVLMSLILRGPGPLLSLAAGVAVAETVAECLAPAVPVGPDSPAAPDNPATRAVTIKWPNDVWLDGAKVAGILVEGRPQAGWAVLGIGLNVTAHAVPSELAGRATTLGLEDPEAVLGVLLCALDRWLAADPVHVLAAVRARDALLGRPLSWADGQRHGVAAGIAADGRLLVESDDGSRQALDAGEVHLGS